MELLPNGTIQEQKVAEAAARDWHVERIKFLCENTHTSVYCRGEFLVFQSSYQ